LIASRLAAPDDTATRAETTFFRWLRAEWSETWPVNHLSTKEISLRSCPGRRGVARLVRAGHGGGGSQWDVGREARHDWACFWTARSAEKCWKVGEKAIAKPCSSLNAPPTRESNDRHRQSADEESEHTEKDDTIMRRANASAVAEVALNVRWISPAPRPTAEMKQQGCRLLPRPLLHRHPWLQRTLSLPPPLVVWERPRRPWVRPSSSASRRSSSWGTARRPAGRPA